MRKAARGIGRLGVTFEAILTSPLIRARQTADIVAAELSLESCVEEIAVLAPESSTDQLLSILSRFNEHKNVLLVGHEPFLGKLVGVFLSGKNDAELAVPQKKGGICRIDIESLPLSTTGQLQWLLTPKQLRLMAR